MIVGVRDGAAEVGLSVRGSNGGGARKMSELCKLRPAAAANLRGQALKQPMRVLTAKPASKIMTRRRCLSTSSRLDVMLMAVLLVAGVYLCYKFYSYAISFGEGMVYYWVVPLWARRLIEKTPEKIIPVRYPEYDYEEEDDINDSAPPEGARKVGKFWVSTLSTSPNITLVHNFMTDAECDEVMQMGRALDLVDIGLKDSEILKASKTSGIADAEGWNIAGRIVDFAYGFIRTSTGIFVGDDEIEELKKNGHPDAKDRFFRLMYRAEQLTSLPMGNFNLPFIQRYAPGQQFRAHVRTHKGAPKTRSLSSRMLCTHGNHSID